MPATIAPRIPTRRAPRSIRSITMSVRRQEGRLRVLRIGAGRAGVDVHARPGTLRRRPGPRGRFRHRVQPARWNGASPPITRGRAPRGASVLLVSHEPIGVAPSCCCWSWPGAGPAAGSGDLHPARGARGAGDDFRRHAHTLQIEDAADRESGRSSRSSPASRCDGRSWQSAIRSPAARWRWPAGGRRCGLALIHELPTTIEVAIAPGRCSRCWSRAAA
jgi:hypothetical protein